MAYGIKRANEELKTKATASNWVRRLTIGDGERAWFRYMCTGDENDHRFATYNVHKKRSEERFETIYCTYEDDGACKECLVTKTSPQFGIWVWVDYILRKKQNPAIGKYDNAKPWPKVRYREEIYYKQDINDIRLWSSGPGNKKYIFNQLLEAYESFGTLMDRVYVMSRTGTGAQDTNYNIKPVAETSQLTEKQIEVYRQLPPIREVASGRQSWPPTDQAEAPEDGAEVLDFNAPEPEPIMAASDTVEVLEGGDDEDTEVVETIREVAPAGNDLIQAAIDDALRRTDEAEETDEPTPLRPRGK